MQFTPKFEIYGFIILTAICDAVIDNKQIF